MEKKNSDVVERFLQYVQMDTQSAEDAGKVPSTEKQKDLGRLLAAQMLEIGMQEVFFDEEHGYVYGKLSATPGYQGGTDTLGLIAHMDTATEISGAGVKPQIIRNYDGRDILLNQEQGMFMRVSEFPVLQKYVGKDLITTDGTTLLGADDKAGVAEIMAAVAYLQEHPQQEHGRLSVAFTPDEEVGAGMRFFDVSRFGADFAYTVDGDALGHLEYENFNAAGATLTVHGRSTHTGDAKGQMKNAARLAMEFDQRIPEQERPETTEGYEGFYHLEHMGGSVEQAVLVYLVREHDGAKFTARKQFLQDLTEQLNRKYGEGTFSLVLQDQYRNMKEKIEPAMYLIDRAEEVFREIGVEPYTSPIRGGTDGATLSFMGVPCPNLCTGGQNYHGRYEFCCIQEMETITEFLIRLAGKKFR